MEKSFKNIESPDFGEPENPWTFIFLNDESGMKEVEGRFLKERNNKNPDMTIGEFMNDNFPIESVKKMDEATKSRLAKITTLLQSKYRK